MSLTVLHVGFPFAPVRPASVGGAEQILRLLDRGLMRRGHQSIVIAPAGSRVRGRLIATPRVASTDTIDDASWHRVHTSYRTALDDTLRQEAVDIIHMHGVDFMNYLPAASAVPIVVTLHLPIEAYGERLRTLSHERLTLQCVSANQRRTIQAAAAPIGVIPNGVPLGHRRPIARRRRTGALMLGRICPEKGVHLALDAARRARVPLTIAGDVSPFEQHRRYFHEAIVPRLSADRRFIGPVGPRRKQRLLRRARCLLVPSLVAETSSLVSMEALACGTPVIAFGSGALPEIVDEGVTGFLVEAMEEMARAMDRVPEIDRHACRTCAEARFSATRMIDDYLRLYESVCPR